jgi:DNA-binding YbaB/EbfC family protein
MINPLTAGKNILEAKRKYDEFQKQMRQVTAVGESKKGLVKITINGLNEVVLVNIDDELIGDKEELQKHIRDSFNDAKKKMEKEAVKGIDKDKAMDMLKGIMG